MGSSDKKKKDKKKDKKKKHRHERSESPTKHDKHEKRRRKEESPNDECDSHEKTSISVPKTSKIREKPSLKSSDSPKREVNEPVAAGGDSVSLSIEETNNLRAKLGLKPLDTGTESKTTNEVHAPPKNMRKVLETQKLAERMKTIQEKRRIKQQMSSIKSLGSSTADYTDTVAWVNRSRNQAARKALADAQTKMLDSMDDEFGIGDLVDNERISSKGKQYTSKDLHNLTVLHDMGSFKEGQMTILTLQDKDVLDEEGEDDVLVNVNMLDNERADKNNELKKKKPDYNPYGDELDEHGNLKRQNMLSKYDEVIEGEQIKRFKISEADSVEVIRRKMTEAINKRPGQVSLESTHLRSTAKEYFTTDEVAAFKKPRKKKMRKIRKTNMEDILPLPGEEIFSSDLGTKSDKDKRKGRKSRQIKSEPDTGDNMEIDIDEGSDMQQGTRGGGGGRISEKDLYQIRLEDEDNELELALARSRRSKLLDDKKKTILECLVALPIKEEHIPGVSKTSQAIVLDQTAEFAKGIGAAEEEEAREAEEAKVHEPMDAMETGGAMGDWKDVDFVTATFGEFQDYDQSRVETQEVIEAEPSLQRGLMGALQVAQRKGFIDKDKRSVNAKDVSDAVKATGSLRARFYQVDRDAAKDTSETGRRGGREPRVERDYSGGGSSGSFPEKKNYNPDINIVYTDCIGRELNCKEAFRQLSHKFHGKGSGKMKTEKRMKKAIEQMALKKMESDDTPLGSAALLREKQKDANSAYIVLSGGNRIPNDPNSTSIAKLSKR